MSALRYHSIGNPARGHGDWKVVRPSVSANRLIVIVSNLIALIENHSTLRCFGIQIVRIENPYARIVVRIFVEHREKKRRMQRIGPIHESGGTSEVSHDRDHFPGVVIAFEKAMTLSYEL